uniref:Uncharacterized protein n=1 Tax=Arundo donax TaxID=35708 RepID=A0A0A8YSX4_ARUDO
MYRRTYPRGRAPVNLTMIKDQIRQDNRLTIFQNNNCTGCKIFVGQ